MSISSDGDVRPDDFFLVDPFAIEVREDLDEIHKPTAAEIVDMAVSLHVHGQRRAVECRKSNDDGLLLIHGFIRTAAARLIRSGFKYIDPETQGEVTVKDKRFKLWVIISGTEDAPREKTLESRDHLGNRGRAS